MELLWITNATYLDNYRIALTFNNGTRKTVDLVDYSFSGIFAPLRNVERFREFHLSDWTITWDNGADIAPETLYAM
jgi:hypothetical protein